MCATYYVSEGAVQLWSHWNEDLITNIGPLLRRDIVNVFVEQTHCYSNILVVLWMFFLENEYIVCSCIIISYLYISVHPSQIVCTQCTCVSVYTWYMSTDKSNLICDKTNDQSFLTTVHVNLNTCKYANGECM